MKKKLFLLSLFLLVAILTSACGPSTPAATPTPSGDAALGQEAYTKTCIACHGADAKGMPNLGKDLTTSQYVKESSQQQLVEFFKVGRSASDPANTTGVDMPPKGGNPALSDTDLLNIAAFIKSINK